MTKTTVSRRIFMMTSSGSAVALATVALTPTQAAESVRSSTVEAGYPRRALGKASAMPLNQVVSFTYPDPSSPCYAIRLGTEVPGGIGPNRDIVAYSGLCSHMGCPIAYDPAERTFKCGCHFSVFDPEASGQMVCGQATEDLPQVVLEYDAATDILNAVSVRGLLYGRRSNIL